MNIVYFCKKKKKDFDLDELLFSIGILSFIIIKIEKIFKIMIYHI